MNAPGGDRPILVTGAGGLVGSAVAAELARHGLPVIAVYRKNFPETLSALPGLALVPADLRDPSGLPQNYRALVHCAAEVPGLCPDDTELYRSNVEGTRAIFAHAAAAGVARIVYCSSMAVYGHIEEAVVDPETPILDPGAYGRSKLEGERLLGSLIQVHPGTRGVSIRLPGVVGAGSRRNFLSDILPQILAGQTVSVRNPEASFNNIVHVADLAEFMCHLLSNMPEGHTVTTIAADEAMSIREVIATLCATAKQPESVAFSEGGQPFLISPEPARALGYAVPSVRDSLIRFVRDNLALSRDRCQPKSVDRPKVL